MKRSLPNNDIRIYIMDFLRNRHFVLSDHMGQCCAGHLFLKIDNGVDMIGHNYVMVNNNIWIKIRNTQNTLIISRPKNENVVMLSEHEYNEMLKAKKNADYLAMIDKSMAEAEAGGFIIKTIAELEACE